jgi:two-component sensor histidine kinase
VISSLLNLQQQSIEDPALQEKFISSIMRVNTMARIHEMIYGDKNLSSINIEKYFTKLLRSLYQIYKTEASTVDVRVTMDVHDVIFFPDKAIPLGLILNEIACNSFKYAFNDDGVFYLTLSEENGKFLLVIGDNGKGLPENLGADSLGLSLIPILCDQIDGELEIVNSKKGLEYRIAFEH